MRFSNAPIVLLVAALSLLMSLGARPAQAATYAFDFEITLLEERIFVVGETPPATAQPPETNGATPVSGWQDASVLGVSDQLGIFGLKLGESGTGALTYTDRFSYDLQVNGRDVWTFYAWIGETDPSGGAKFTFSTPGEEHDFDFIRWQASTANDGIGSVFTDGGSVLSFLGYEASFSLAARGAQQDNPVAVTPLPPAPALLLTALAGLAWMRRRRLASA